MLAKLDKAKFDFILDERPLQTRYAMVKTIAQEFFIHHEQGARMGAQIGTRRIGLV